MLDFQSFIARLSRELTEPLPGEAVQLQMAPAKRKMLLDEYRAGLKHPRQSAVLVILYPYENEVYTILTLRPAEFRVHSDQVSFPGGRFEDRDKDLIVTALRETREEIGINESALSVIGKLTPVYIPVSNFMVHPFIALSVTLPSLSINPTEVKEVIETDVRIFLNEAIKGQGQFRSGEKHEIEAPFYQIDGYKIWGATAMILSELSHIIKNVLN